ncbi:MAG: hypothetical protein KAT35_03715, partial [Candidatus Aenigmarchaeota archaeon]|nr:hypothetical protein [Candidatus Aenigmarchaeota archaeon]
QDVLQYIMLDLSGTADTNLQSVLAYKGVAPSPNPGSRTRIYLNTTASQSNISYEITNTGLTPVLYIDIDYSNSAGGHDLFSGGTNTLLFNVTMNSTQVLSGVTMTLRFSRNLVGPADSFHLYGAGSSSGSALTQDTDSDGYFDSAQWIGNLGSGDVEVWFMGDTTPGANFNEASMSVDLDQGVTSQAQYQDSTQTFTGITFSNRFSRGPIREGVIIADMGNWAARGFIRNMATGLDYTIHGWELYKLGESTSVLNSTSEISLYPGNTEYTEWYDTGIPRVQDKSGYFATSWDWEVGWGPSSYTSASLATLVLPVLYEIYVWPGKSVAVGSNSEAGVSLSVRDRARHLGHSSLQAGRVTINSVLPRLSSGGASNSWSPFDIRVMYVNGSGRLDITSQVSITSQAAGATDGYVNVDIADVAAVIGSGLGQNQDILLVYSV